MRRSARPGPFALAAARAFGAGLVALAALAPSAVAAAALGSSSLALWPHGIAMLILAGLLVTGLAIVAALIAMRRLRNALALQRDIFGAIPQPRQVVDSDGHTLLANKAFYAFFGNAARPTPELLLEEASDDDYACDQLQRLNANARNGTAGHLELRVRPRALGAAAGAAGAEWRYVVAYPISGRPGTVLWMVDDITLRRQMEQVIQEDHERFMDLLEFAPVGFYSVDAEGYFLFANRTLCDWLGLSYEELDGGMIRLHDVLAAPPAGAVAPYESTGGAGAGASEVCLSAADGGEFLASISQDLATAQDGQVLRTRSVVRNLSRERALAEALERSVQRFKRFFIEAPVGIALLDVDGQVTECNRAFAGLVGRQVEELATVSIFALVRDEDREGVRAALARAGVGDGAGADIDVDVDAPTPEDAPAPGNLLGAMQVPVEARLVGAAEKACAIYINRMTDTTGAARGFIAHLIDTTERKNLEVQFAQSQKMQAVGQLAGGIAHDFNNLLTAMIGFSDLLLLRHRPGDQSFADVMQIKQNANRAANLVRQLLAFSRQQTLQPRTLNVTDILAELSHLLRRLLGESIELEMVHGRDLHAVRADQVQLEQVIINLAVNARDAMDHGGTLTIRTRNETTAREKKYKAESMPPGDYVLIEVRDTGRGIAQEHRDRIFDPFFSTKEVGAGTGLGLSTVYGIVKQTEGFVFVDTEPGAGTLFSIYLPRAAAKAEPGAVAEETGARAGRDLTGMGTVLLVEDEDAVRAFGARALRNKGYEVVEARSGDAALQVMEKQGDEIDLLVTDVVMPQLDGPTLVRQVRETWPNLKVIFISGYTEDAFRQKLGEDEHIHFLPKPFSLKQLAAKVKEVMSEEARAPTTAQRSSGA